MHSMRRRLFVLVALAVAAAVAATLLFFEPWKLVIDQRVDEARPGLTGIATEVAPEIGSAPGPRVLATGVLISHEHPSTGIVAVLQLPDGSRVLRIENLRTSNGPHLEVWLADAPVVPDKAGRYLFDDGRHIDLGDLKGNIGSSNYPVPADVELTDLRSVTIWCERFSVSFAAAALS